MLKIDQGVADLLGSLDFDPATLKAKYIDERNRRVARALGVGAAQADTQRAAAFSRDPWGKPGFKRPSIEAHNEVIVVGGGFGGLLAGARLYEAGFRDIRVIDEAGDFGGTWYWNRYPGAMCDIEAHIYMPLLEELSYTPRHRYAYAHELLQHSRNIARRYDLYRLACFQTSITSAHWHEVNRTWRLETNRGDRLSARWLVLACGRQSRPKLPKLPGIADFQGHAFHSSRWDYAYTGGAADDFTLSGLADKRVAVIGTGATAVQIVPEVAKWAKELVVFQRTPSSVGVRDQAELPPDCIDAREPGWQRQRRRNFQEIISGKRPEVDFVQDGWTKLSAMLQPIEPQQLPDLLGRKPTAEERTLISEVYDYRVMNGLRRRIDEIVRDPQTAQALKPWYRWACKRPCFHDDYLEAFNRPNVRLVDTLGQGVEAFCADGAIAGGVTYPIDCAIFATGFEAGISYARLTGFELHGVDGIPLSVHWADGARSLHGMHVHHFPNCFLVGGNVQSAAAINATDLLDEQAKHLAQILGRAHRREATRIEAEPEAVERYVSSLRQSPQSIAQLEFYKECTPGYYNAEGRAGKSADLFFGERYPDGPVAFYEMLERWREEQDMAGLQFEPRAAADLLLESNRVE